MIQQHLVYHYTSFDEGVTYYEPNMQSAYYLVRSGKIVEFIDDRLGKYAAKVMSTILYLGHAQVGYLETLPELQPERVDANGAGIPEDDNGDEDPTAEANGEHATSEKLALLHPTLKALAGHGYISRVREAQFQSYADNVLDIERAIKSKPDVKAMKGKKLEETVAEGTLNLLRERLDGDLTRGLMFNGVPRGAKRKHGNAASSTANGQARSDYAAVDEDEEGEEEENEWSDDDLGEDTIPMEVRPLLPIGVLLLREGPLT